MPTVNKKYLDLDGLEYYNDKIQEQLSESFDGVNGDVERLSSEVEALASMNNYAPIPVSSVSAMTDHSRVYVLTTDGRWYYWDSTISAWTPGGTYQASSLGDNSVSFGNLNNQLAGIITEVSNDVTKLHNYAFNTNANSVNLTSPMLLKAGTTISVSSDFVANYRWRLTRVNPDLHIKIASTSPNINNLNTNTSYTLANDELCVFQWCPIDSNWNTTAYTVDRLHKLDNNDVTITYYWLHDERYKLIDINSSYIYNTLFASVNYDTGLTYYDSARLSTTRLYSDYPILFHTKSGYQYDISYYNDDVNGSARASHTGWSTGDVLIAKNKWFVITIRKQDQTAFNVADYADVFELNSYANYQYINQYVDSHISGVGQTYNYKGIDLDMQYKHGYEYAASTPLPSGMRSIQGFTIYGDYIFQFYATGQGLLRIFDKATGALVAEHNTYTSHGGSCAFSNIYADPNDDFPLLYVSSGNYDYPQIVVLRIQDVNTVSVYKTYQMDADKIGYWSEQCYDFETGLCYSFGYTKNSFSDMTNNPVKVCVIDLNSETLISDNKYSLDVVDNYTIPYVYVIQSAKFKNGLCYIPSSYQSNVQASDIRVFDPNRKTFVANFPGLPRPLRGEIEDLDFVENPTTSKYDMIVGVNGDPNYWKLSFM